MMQPRMAVAALITTNATTYACVILSALMLIELPVATPLLFLSPLPSRRHHNVYSSSDTLLSATKSSSASIKRIMVPSSMDISILEPIGNGTFGGVYHARDEKSGRPLVAKCARAITIPESDGGNAIDNNRAKQNANSYLEIEAQINSKLIACTMTPRNTKDAQYQLQLLQKRHLAPYMGECKVNDTTYLVWEASGGENTLEDYIEMDNGWVQLAVDLGLGSSNDFVVEEERKETIAKQQRQNLHSEIAAEVLRQILKGLAYCHSCGIVHRDIKPANILVDPTSHTLRIIDFGSACCMSTWTTNKLGYKGENKGPRSILYCAPEEFIDEEHPYAFDIYGAAITWIRAVLSEDANDCNSANNNSATGEDIALGLGNEDELFQWRIDVRNFGHNLVAWEEYATLHNTLPYGWDSMFGSSRHGINALRLLSNMMSYNPSSRISAAEALISEYLNPECDAETPPELPPAMPFSIMSHIERWKKDKEVHGGECQLEDLFSKVVAVELDLPLGLTFGQNRGTNGKDQRGVMITDIVDGTDASKLDLCMGDLLLAIGSIDVEDASLDHVTELLEQWPPQKPVSLLLIRNDQ